MEEHKSRSIHGEFNGLKWLAGIGTTVISGLILVGIVGVFGIKDEMSAIRGQLVEVKTEVTSLKGTIGTLQGYWREDSKELRDRLRQVEGYSR